MYIHVDNDIMIHGLLTVVYFLICTSETGVPHIGQDMPFS